MAGATVEGKKQPEFIFAEGSACVNSGDLVSCFAFSGKSPCLA